MDSNAKIFSNGIGEVTQESIGELRCGDAVLVIDASDPDFMDKLQAAGMALQNAGSPGSVSDGDKVRALISELDSHFDELFGEGTAEKAFKTRSLIQRINVWGSIVEIANEQKTVLGSKMAAFNSKYNAGNRAQKRAAEKNKNKNKNRPMKGKS